jgi:hypothetical protein
MRWVCGCMSMGLMACGSAGNPSDGNDVGGLGAMGGSNAGSAGTTSSGGSSGTVSSGGNSAGGSTLTSGGSGASGGSSGDAGSGNSGGGSSECPPTCGTPPDVEPGESWLTPGVWTDISPIEINGDAGGALGLAIDPNQPLTVYAGIEVAIGGGVADGNGLWKTTDGGATWNLLGADTPDTNPYDDATNYLDLPISIVVDPTNSNRVYVAEGVRGGNNGFWISTDAGTSWTRSTNDKNDHDIALIAMEPCNPAHLLIASHGYWGDGNGGIKGGGFFESTDSGESWKAIEPNGWGGAGTKGIVFLSHPSTGTCDPGSWLVTANGFWRTTNAGETWTDVGGEGTPHGTNEFYYATDGTLYAGAWDSLQRSTDNGASWDAVPGLGGGTYYAMVGDGETLYTMVDNYPPPTAYVTSPEGDGLSWAPYSDTTNPGRGPIRMRFDSVNRIIYSANWNAGVWALKLPE